MPENALRRPVILLVEDSPDDRAFAKTAFQLAEIDAELVVVEDGETAGRYLRHQGEFAGPGRASRPAVVLLDLRLPAVDGYEVLAELRRDPQLATLPVVVFTTSNSPEDIDRCYALGCNSYLVKPSQLGPLVAALRDLGRYWCELMAAPSGGWREP